MTRCRITTGKGSSAKLAAIRDRYRIIGGYSGYLKLLPTSESRAACESESVKCHVCAWPANTKYQCCIERLNDVTTKEAETMHTAKPAQKNMRYKNNLRRRIEYPATNSFYIGIRLLI